MIKKAVILAAGSASRMQYNVEKFVHNERELSAIRKGEKMAVSYSRFPFLDYQILNCINAGIKQVNLVLRPEDEFFIDHYLRVGKNVFPEISISFSFQQTPDGTAHAVLAAKKFSGNDRFLVLNGDNLYSVKSLEMLCHSPEGTNALVAFNVEGFNPWVRDRLRSYAVLITKNGMLKTIIEKADNPESFHVNDTLYSTQNSRISIRDCVLVSMNLWCFTPTIHEVCTHIHRHSPRRPGKPGEYELPDAVMYLINMGIPIMVYYAYEDVLDLTRAEDIEIVGKQIKRNLKTSILELEKRYKKIHGYH